jgi:long-subunit acyl-CoA synthetase (AMP-forming)
VENICLYADSSREFVVAVVVPVVAELAKLSDKPAADAVKEAKVCSQVEAGKDVFVEILFLRW